jgi:hypothetical protein
VAATWPANARKFDTKQCLRSNTATPHTVYSTTHRPSKSRRAAPTCTSRRAGRLAEGRINIVIDTFKNRCCIASAQTPTVKAVLCSLLKVPMASRPLARGLDTTSEQVERVRLWSPDCPYAFNFNRWIAVSLFTYMRPHRTFTISKVPPAPHIYYTMMISLLFVLDVHTSHS